MTDVFSIKAVSSLNVQSDSRTLVTFSASFASFLLSFYVFVICNTFFYGSYIITSTNVHMLFISFTGANASFAVTRMSVLILIVCQKTLLIMPKDVTFN